MSAEFLTAPNLRARHGFFTRRGGVSTGPYASLNCSLSSGDAPENLAQNRALAAQALGAHPAHLLGVTQIHGTTVIHATAPWLPGQGPKADAMVSATPGLALGVITADCAPVLFAAPGGIVGAAHAGWRGAVAGILEATIAAMQTLGATPETITASIGPCIAQTSYEVGQDFLDAILSAQNLPLPPFAGEGRGPSQSDGKGEGPRRTEQHAENAPTFPQTHTQNPADFFTPGTRPNHWHFNLPAYCAARLAALGIQTTTLGLDTCADETRFFSHRRRTLAGGGPIGHQISIIVAGSI